MPLTTPAALLLIAACLIGLSLLDHVVRLHQALREVDALMDENEDLRDDLYLMERDTTVVLLAAAPLIAKTDWTTGSWGGRGLADLQAAEKARNADIDLLREAYGEHLLVLRESRPTPRQDLAPETVSGAVL